MLQVLHWIFLRHHRHRCRLRPDNPLLRLLLSLHHKGEQCWCSYMDQVGDWIPASQYNCSGILTFCSVIFELLHQIYTLSSKLAALLTICLATVDSHRIQRFQKSQSNPDPTYKNHNPDPRPEKNTIQIHNTAKNSGSKKRRLPEI